MKQLSIIGSTGSIGTQALDIVRQRAEDFQVKALSAGKNLQLLIDQIKEFKPEYVSIINDNDKTEIKNLFPNISILKDIEEIASLDGVDIFLSAIVGIAGLKANLIALEHAKRVAVANKETLVSAAHLVQAAQEKHGSELIPVDSEHVAIHQCLADHPEASVKEILLTSSGGPFRTLPIDKFSEITLEQALKHPTWNMGAKITVDSSTLMNKGLEVIEANALFGIDYQKIKVVIHPQSIVHSAVSFNDGNTMAQLSMPNMRVPIQYALDYPNKNPLKLDKELDIFEIGVLEFQKPNTDKFPALNLAYQAGRLGHSYPSVLNSANEAAVNLFLREEIKYLDIIAFVEKELEKHKIIENPSIDDILGIDETVKHGKKEKTKLY